MVSEWYFSTLAKVDMSKKFQIWEKLPLSLVKFLAFGYPRKEKFQVAKKIPMPKFIFFYIWRNTFFVISTFSRVEKTLCIIRTSYYAVHFCNGIFLPQFTKKSSDKNVHWQFPILALVHSFRTLTDTSTWNFELTRE